jgi:hypothetical protein
MTCPSLYTVLLKEMPKAEQIGAYTPCCEANQTEASVSIPSGSESVLESTSYAP